MNFTVSFQIMTLMHSRGTRKWRLFQIPPLRYNYYKYFKVFTSRKNNREKEKEEKKEGERGRKGIFFFLSWKRIHYHILFQKLSFSIPIEIESEVSTLINLNKHHVLRAYSIIWIYYTITVSLIIANHLDWILLCIFWQLDNGFFRTNLKTSDLNTSDWSVYGQFLDFRTQSSNCCQRCQSILSCDAVLKVSLPNNFETVEMCIFLIFSPWGKHKNVN